jgi:hypothetical protein
VVAVANTFITPNVVASRGLATLYNNMVLAALVSRDFDAEFSGKVGDTITIRKPATFTAATFNTSTRTTTWQDATEDSVDVTLDTIKHVPFHVTDEQMTLEITDFQTQLLTPAMEALAQALDGDLAEKLVDAAEGAGGGGTVNLSDDPATVDSANFVFRKAREKLTRNKLPLTERFSVLSPEATTVALGDEIFLAADKSGSTDALRNAIVGRALGFETYETQVYGAGAGDRGQADGVAFHRSAVIAAIRPLNKPRGVAAENAAVQNYKGLSLRVIYSYDEEAKQDQVVVDILYGLATAYPEGAVQLNFGQGS